MIARDELPRRRVRRRAPRRLPPVALSAVAFLVVGVGLLAYANGRVRRLAAA